MVFSSLLYFELRCRLGEARIGLPYRLYRRRVSDQQAEERR